MAGNTINFELRLNSNIKNETKDAKDLNKELDKAAGRRGTSASARQQTVEYGRARGSMEATGASGRDFANQAQGLGGLVRLYATYAANVFALSAAFQSLSAAMDTQNMIRGLTQLGAASGQSLTAISKQFAAATQNSLSMREAMESTTRAVSSGLSGIQAVEIAEMATKASQALGVNLTDAVSRLTRGITKFEPELLDELGIFVRLDSAVEKYARQLGKAASTLTENERLQAFYNAVIEQTRKKFGEIDIPINPYTKFLAVLKDISFTALSLLNTVLTPLVKLLSENPVVLTAAISLLAKNLLGNVIPVIKDYNQQLTNSTKVAKDNFTKQAAAAKAAADASRQQLLLRKKDLLEGREDKSYKALEAAEKNITFDKITDRKTQAHVTRILSKDITDLTSRELNYLKVLSQRGLLDKSIYKLRESAFSLNTKIIAIENQLNGTSTRRVGILSQEWIATTRLEAARKRLAITSIAQQTAETVDSKGFGSAFKDLPNLFKEGKLGVLGGIFAGIASAAVLAGKAVGFLLTGLTRLIVPIGIIYTAYEILSAIFVTNQKEVAAYEQKLDELTETTNTATAAAKKYKDTISIEGLVAQTTAFQNSNKALEQTIDTYEKAIQKMDGFSKFIDATLGFVNRGQTQGFIKQTTESIKAQLASITSPELLKQAEKTLAETLGISAATPELINSRLQTAAKESRAALALIVRDANTALQRILADQKTLVDPLATLDSGFKELEKTLKELEKSFEPKDKFTDYIVALSKQTDALSKSFVSLSGEQAVFNKLLTDRGALNIFPAETLKLFNESLDYYEEAKKSEAELSKLIKQRADAQDRLKISQGQIDSLDMLKPKGYQKLISTFQQAGGAALDSFKAADKKIKELQPKVNNLFLQASASFREGLIAASQQAVRIITDGYARATKLVEIDFKKQALGLLPQTPEVVRELTKLELQSIDVRREEITAIRNLTNAIQTQKLTQDIDRLTRERNRLQEAGGQGGADRIASLNENIQVLEVRRKAYENPQALIQEAEAGTVTPDTAALKIAQQQLGGLRELEALTTQKQLAQIRGAGQEQAAAAAQNVERQELALNRALEEEAAYRKNNLAYLQKSTNEQAVMNAWNDNTLATLKEELQYSKDLAKATEFQAMAVQASNLGLTELSKYYESAAKKAEDVANANLRSTQINRLGTLDQALRAAGTEKEVKAIQQQGEWLERNITNRETATKNTLDQLNLESQRIEFLRSEGMISEQAAKNQLYALDRRKLELQTSLEILGVEKDILKIETKRDADIRALAGGQVEEAERIRKNAAAEIESARERAQAIQNITAARLKDMDMQARISDREKAYAKAFQNTFDGLADSLVQFAMTGEKTFKDLFRNLVADLARFELRLQTSALWMAIRGPIMQSLFGTTPIAGDVPYASGHLAKGGMFESGVRKYAKGGTFTNSIVDSPTLFKFARGTGLMGEAGPEAIMPLKRDSQGNLGVRASNQPATKVEVVVNNNSQAQATAQETMDSRGNRRIEVTIGDMVSGEMVRPGSGVRQTMQTNYGLRPALVRR